MNRDGICLFNCLLFRVGLLLRRCWLFDSRLLTIQFFHSFRFFFFIFLSLKSIRYFNVLVSSLCYLLQSIWISIQTITYFYLLSLLYRIIFFLYIFSDSTLANLTCKSTSLRSWSIAVSQRCLPCFSKLESQLSDSIHALLFIFE